MLHHCTYDSVTTETEDLVDLQSDFGMKALFKETPYTLYLILGAPTIVSVPEYRSRA